MIDWSVLAPRAHVSVGKLPFQLFGENTTIELQLAVAKLGLDRMKLPLPLCVGLLKHTLLSAFHFNREVAVERRF
jgi:hypothetical protein